jgi:hypothetical protein
MVARAEVDVFFGSNKRSIVFDADAAFTSYRNVYSGVGWVICNGQGYVVAMNLETTEEELIHAVFPHPTLSEMMHESVLDAYGRVIHT